MSSFSQKKTWFSHLVRNSPIVIKFTSDVIGPSSDKMKYHMGESDSGYEYKMRYFKERTTNPLDGTYLVIENDVMEREVKDIPGGIWVEVNARREDGRPTLEYSPVKATSGPSKGRTQTRQGGSEGGSIVEDLKRCQRAAKMLVDKGEVPTGSYWELVQKYAVSIYIQAERSNWQKPLLPQEEESEAEPIEESGIDIEDLVEKVDWDRDTTHDSRDPKEVLSGIQSAIAEGLNEDRRNNIIDWLQSEIEAEQKEEEGEIGADEELPF